MRLAKDAICTPASTGNPSSGQGSAQDAGPASKISTDERQPDGNLESALSRLGGMLESAGPLTDQACSQLEVPGGQLLVSILADILLWQHDKFYGISVSCQGWMQQHLLVLSSNLVLHYV